MEYLKFWDFAVIVYLVGWLLALVLVHDRLSKPECYRIPIALVISALWPLVLLMCLGLYIEDILYEIKEKITKGE